MKLATIRLDGKERAVVLERERVLVIDDPSLPTDVLGIIERAPTALGAIKERLLAPGQRWLAQTEVQFCAPIPQPRKNIFCVGRNYKEHIIEGARAKGIEATFPKVPEFFSKPTTAVIGADDAINTYPHLTSKVDYEVELAIVIGKTVRDLTLEDAEDAVFGYTIVNDISARDAQFAHGQWFKGKGYDTFCPIGPCIVTKDEFGDPSGHRIWLSVNGEMRQDSNTADLLFDVPHILVALSAGMTLHAGDIIATGTPSGVAFGMTPQRFLAPGDRIVAGVDGVGELRNVVI